MFKKLFSKSRSSTGDSPNKTPESSPQGKKDDMDSSVNSSGDVSLVDSENLAGIGIIFQLAPDGGLYIKSMSPDGAAHDSGILQQGDCLMQVDGVPVFGKDADFVTSKIMGKIGTPIATKFRRNVIQSDGTGQFRYVAPVLTRGKCAELPQPAGVGIIFKVGPDKAMYVKSLSPDGPAKISDQVFVDDCLLSVDNFKVHCQPVIKVTPLLTGAFGTSVVLGLKRKDGKQVKVTLKRGKRASFRDETTPLEQQGITTKAISVMVPEGSQAGDLIAARDDNGLTVKVRVPPGAVRGTLLRVPVGLNVDKSMSDPKDLERILKEVEEVPGRDNVFQWNGTNIYGPKRNGDGTITIVDADSGRVVWHGQPFGKPEAGEKENGAAPPSDQDASSPDVDVDEILDFFELPAARDANSITLDLELQVDEDDKTKAIQLQVFDSSGEGELFKSEGGDAGSWASSPAASHQSDSHSLLASPNLSIGAMPRAGMGRVILNRVGVAQGLQVLGGTMLQSVNGGDGPDDVKVSYENLRDVKSVIEQFERLLVM